jgi:heme-degrading monooxygenase HmoA
MHVRAATVQIQSGKIQEGIDAYNNSVVPAQKAQKGYQGSYLMTNAGSGNCLAISVWESEADMLAGESSGGYYQEAIAKFASIFAAPPTLEHYELSSENSP